MNKKQAALMLKIMELITTLLSETVLSSPHFAAIQSYIWSLRESFGFTYYEALDSYAIASDEEVAPACVSEEPKKRMIDADELLQYLIKAAMGGPRVTAESVMEKVEEMLKK